MIDQLRLLIRLQSVDSASDSLEKQITELPARVEELSRQQKELSAEISQAEKQLNELLAQRKELERRSDEIRARIRRAENRLMAARTTREYQAATAEIEEGRDSLKETEDLLVDVMERQEEVEARLKELRDRGQNLAQELEEQRRLMDERLANAQAELQRLKHKRAEITSQLQPELLADYDFIRTRRQGIAVAPVVKGSCLVCHMQLAPQQFNELQRMDKLMNCPSCRRIIFWAEAEQFADLVELGGEKKEQ